MKEQNRMSTYYLTFILGSVTFVLLLWMLINVFKANLLFVQIIGLIGCLVTSHLLFQKVSVSKAISKRSHIILHSCLLITLLLWSLPLFFNPDLPIGKGFTAPTHDGLVLYLANHGQMPADASGIFDYPNGMHVLSAFFVQLGWPVMHGNLGSILLMIVVSSYSLFLLLNMLYGEKNSEFHALFAGLFSILSYVLPWMFFVSRPQVFTMLFVFPLLYFFVLSFDIGNGKKEMKKEGWWPAVGFWITLAAITVSYTGLPIVLFSLCGVAIVLHWIVSQKVSVSEIKRAAIVLGVGLIVLGAFSFVQTGDYWANLSQNLMDCNDSSNYVFPLLRPLFVILMLGGLYGFSRQGLWKKRTGMFALVLLFISVVPVVYEIAFTFTYSIHDRESCLNAPYEGIFSDFTRFKMHRLSVLQVFSFVLVLPGLVSLVKNDRWKWIVSLGVVGVLLVFPFDAALYPMVAEHGMLNADDLLIDGSDEASALTAPFFLYGSSMQWIERGYSDSFVEVMHELKPFVSESSTLVYVGYGEEQSYSMRYFLWMFFDTNYKYILNPREFYQKYVFDYEYVISQPCIVDDVPESYSLVKDVNDFSAGEGNGFCLFVRG